MSRIGKKIIRIPQGVEVKTENNLICVKGPKGEMFQPLKKGVVVAVQDGNLSVNIESKNEEKNLALWGTYQALIQNMIIGVTQGFEKKLLFEGIGYRATVNGNKLVLNLGYSHPVEIEAPKGISFKTEKNTIIVSGIDKFLVGQVAAEIRAKRKPEPYKGKGIRYENEVIRRKAGKKAVASA